MTFVGYTPPEPVRFLLLELRQTCLSCPSQFDALALDGTQLYVRERHGRLTVQIGGPAGGYLVDLNHGTYSLDHPADIMAVIGAELVGPFYAYVDPFDGTPDWPGEPAGYANILDLLKVPPTARPVPPAATITTPELRDDSSRDETGDV